MFSTIAVLRRHARRLHLLASTVLACLLSPACCASAVAQQPDSPPAELPPVVVTPRPAPARVVDRTSSVTVTTAADVEPDPRRTPPTVVVSPTTVPTRADQVASSVTVITAADMEREQRRTLPDALSEVPGLNIVQTGGAGGQTSVFMRGTNSNHVKVLIDGIDVSDPSNPNNSFDFGQMLTSDIQRIEVLRGPQSGLYGADAIGGVISITTKKGEGPPRVYGTLEAGSFGTFNQTTGVSGSQAGFNYSFNVAHFQSTDTPVTPLELLPPGQKRNNDYYDNVTYSTRLGADLSENFALNFVGRYTDATLKFTGDDFSVFPSVPAAQQSIQTVHQLYTRGEAVWTLFDGRFKNYFGVNYTNTWNWNLNPGSLPAINKGERIKFDWRGVVSLMPGQTLVLGAEQQTDRLSTDVTNAQVGNAAGYVELQSNFAERFFLVSNVRLDDNDAFGDHVTYRIAPVYIVPFTDTKLKASYGTGFKAPTLSELYVNFPAFGFFANPNLKPEQSTGYDVGFEQPIAGDRLRFGVTYFHNDITNLITSNDTFTTYINVGQAQTQGVEAFAQVRVTDQIKLRADYTYTKAIDALTGLELLRRPRDKTSVTALWTLIDPLVLSATVLSVSDWVDTSRDGSVVRLTAPGYTIVNLAASYTMNDQMKLFGRIDNLFNLHYEDPTGFDRPGFGVFVGMRLANR